MNATHQPWALGEKCLDCTHETRRRCPYCVGTGIVRYVGWAEEPWTEIVPGLWLGGHEYQTEAPSYDSSVGMVAPVEPVWPEELDGAEFDVVVSLYEDQCDPGEGVVHLVLRIDDNIRQGLSVDEIEQVHEMALHVVSHVQAGRKVLVRCHAGLNRAALVTCLALVRMGHNPQETIDLVRSKRSRYALFNPRFVDIILAQTQES